jgi:hypothetical protein
MEYGSSTIGEFSALSARPPCDNHFAHSRWSQRLDLVWLYSNKLRVFTQHSPCAPASSALAYYMRFRLTIPRPAMMTRWRTSQEWSEVEPMSGWRSERLLSGIVGGHLHRTTPLASIGQPTSWTVVIAGAFIPFFKIGFGEVSLNRTSYYISFTNTIYWSNMSVLWSRYRDLVDDVAI